ncbi:unnamed protein product [Discosporangium mesarthrocarpum]
MPGVGSLYGVMETRCLKDRPREKDAKQLLDKIADQVKPICVAHKWTITSLEEFMPGNPQLLGMNVNRKKILIRLRPASDPDYFYPYESVLHTMLHELTHMEIGPHSAAFYKMLDDLADECQNLIRQGISGRNMPFAGEGKSLGGGPAAADGRAAALKAAQRRKQVQGIMSSTGKRLGGLGGKITAITLREKVAAAAERRMADSKSCATTVNGTRLPDFPYREGQGTEGTTEKAATLPPGHTGQRTSPRMGHGSGSALAGHSHVPSGGWACGVCTLVNHPPSESCDACGTTRVAVGCHGADGSNKTAPGAAEVPGISGEGIGRRPQPSSAVAKGSMSISLSSPASGCVGGRVGAQDKTGGKGRYRPGGGFVAGAQTQHGRLGRAPNLAFPRTWSCRNCTYINVGEDEKCRGCAGGGQYQAWQQQGVAAGLTRGEVRSSLGVRVREGNLPERKTLPELEEWACTSCTLVNPPSFLVCHACGKERSFEGGTTEICDSEATTVWAGDVPQERQGPQNGLRVGADVMGGGGQGTGQGPDVLKRRREDQLTGPVICQMCTLHNEGHKCLVCAACGSLLPPTQSQANRSRVMDNPNPGLDPSTSRDREGANGGGPSTVGKSVAPPEVVDLS